MCAWGRMTELVVIVRVGVRHPREGGGVVSKCEGWTSCSGARVKHLENELATEGRYGDGRGRLRHWFQRGHG